MNNTRYPGVWACFRECLVLFAGIAGATSALAQPIAAGDTRVSASYLAQSEFGPAFSAATKGINGLANAPTTSGFAGTDGEQAAWSIRSSFAASPAPTLSLSGSVSGTVFQGSSLQAGGFGQASMNYMIDCQPKPQCLGLSADINISGSVSTSVSLSLGNSQTAPTQAAHAYALAEIGTNATLKPTIPLLGNNNFLPAQYNVFFSSGYHVEGFSPANSALHNGIDIHTDVDVLDPSTTQLGIDTSLPVPAGSFSAAPAATSFSIQASGIAGSLYSVFMYGEIGVLSTRFEDSASVSLLVDPVISIDPAFQQAHPEFQFSIAVGPGVGNSVALVPEPESWAMLSAGLCLLAVLARRRRQGMLRPA